MRFRKLRIAWSVAWGVAAVLLVALCVRSYFVAEHYGFNTKLSVALARGGISLFYSHSTYGRIFQSRLTRASS